MKSRNISKHKTKNIYKITVLCGCAIWVLREQIKLSLKTWEGKILRMIYGPVKDHNGWGIRIND
jgi:hypothetical protein